MSRVGVIALACVAIAGCRETQHCPNDDYSYQNGACMPTNGADVGTGPDTGADAGSDTGIDGGNDAGTDGGPCAACGDGSVCSNSGDTADAGDSGRALRCVECVQDSDCAGHELDGGFADAGFTDGGGSDAGGTDGGVLPGRTICESFQCVFGCRTDSECAPNACASDHRCSAYPRRTTSAAGATQCLACDSEDNCDPSSDCVPMTFGPTGTAIPIGSYCLQDLATIASGACPIPYRVGIHSGGATYCGIDSAVTTCDAVLDITTPCTLGMSGPCGRDDIPDDGVCTNIVTVGPACTYRCSPPDNSTCPSPRTCGTTSGTCGGT